MTETVYLIAGGAGLLLVGLGLGYWAAQFRNGKQAAKAADVQKQFDDYRQSVMAHFGRTAEHFQAIGEQYRALYEHMASGADTLLDPQEIDEKLSFMPAAVDEPSGDDDAPAAAETSEPTGSQSDEDADEPQRIYH